MKNFFQVGVMIFAGFIGGVTGSLLFSPSTILAASVEKKARSDVVDLFNSQSKRIAYVGPGRIQQGAFFLFNEKEKLTVQIGSYDGPREAGQPMIGLYDHLERLRILFRLHNSTDSPVVIFKDSYGNDRLIMGLQGAAEEPYIDFVDVNGQSKRFLGTKQK